MDVLEPIEPDEGPGRLAPPPLGQHLGDPYAPSELGAAPSRRRRRLVQAVVATGVVAGLAGAAIGIGVAGSNGRSTLTFRPAASTSGPSSTTNPPKAHARMGRIVGGTVSKVSGDTITVTTPRGNQTATITTTGQTVYRKIVSGKVSDIKAQQTVAAVGTTGANGHLAASYLAIIPADLLKPHAPPAGSPGNPPKGQAPPNAPGPSTRPSPPAGAPHFVIGKVESVSGTSFVVTRGDGTKVTVDTTSATKVFEEASATAADVVPNAHIVAVGTPGATKGSLTATRIEILPAGLPATGAPGMFGFGFGMPFGRGGPMGPGRGFGFGFGHGMGHGMGHGFGQPGSPGSGSPGSGSSGPGPSGPGAATPQSFNI